MLIQRHLFDEAFRSCFRQDFVAKGIPVLGIAEPAPVPAPRQRQPRTTSTTTTTTTSGSDSDHHRHNGHSVVKPTVIEVRSPGPGDHSDVTTEYHSTATQQVKSTEESEEEEDDDEDDVEERRSLKDLDQVQCHSFN